MKSKSLGFELEKEVNYVAKQVPVSRNVSGWACLDGCNLLTGVAAFDHPRALGRGPADPHAANRLVGLDSV